MICSKCGNQIPDNAKFCAKCGTPAQAAPAMPVVEDIFVAPFVPEMPIAPVVEETPAAPFVPEMPIAPVVEETPAAPAAEETSAPAADAVFPTMPTFDLGPMMEDFSATGAIVPPSTTEKVKKSKSGGGSSYSGGGSAMKGIVIAIVVLLILGLLAAAAYFVLGMDFNLGGDSGSRKSSSSKDKDDDKKPSKTPIFGGTSDDDVEEDVIARPNDTVVEAGPSEEVVESGFSSGNPYYTVYKEYSAYVLYDSDSKYYTVDQLSRLSYEELKIARQELSARYGIVSSDQDLQEYFDNRDWYTPSGSTPIFNDCEKATYFILSYLIAQHDNDGTPTPENPYLTYLFTRNGYVLSNSATTQLGAKDLQNLTAEELAIAEAEIFARYGTFPNDPQLYAYFSCNSSFSLGKVLTTEDMLNDKETTNLYLIRLYLRKAQGVTYTASNPFQQVDIMYGAYVIPYSSTQSLVIGDISLMGLAELCIARNEILARHGYTFTDSELQEYFLSQDWYMPNSAPGDTAALGLSTTENQNVMMIKEYENELKSYGFYY